MNKIIAYQGEPGANSHIACSDVYPGWETFPCASFEEALVRHWRGPRRTRHDPDRKFARGPRRRHPSFPARLRPPHHRRIFPADPFPPARRQGREDRGSAQRLQPCPRARPVPQDHQEIQSESRDDRRYGGFGARGRGMGRQEPRLARAAARRRHLRPRRARPLRRGRGPQHHALRDPVARAAFRTAPATGRC